MTEEVVTKRGPENVQKYADNVLPRVNKAFKNKLEIMFLFF
jgi:hypothetical protein